MPGPLNICVIHGRADLLSYWRSQGHTVLNLAPETVFFSLPEALNEAGFEPDMVLQLERLSQRTLVSGLDKVNCPKAFWSIDTHLNLFWHQWYGKLFDVVLTTQRAWIPELRRSGIANAQWLPWYGTQRPMTSHHRRQRDIAFVGRVTPHRPTRLWFASFLRDHFGVEPVDNLTFGQMMGYYAQSRIVPNETIFGEVNFRLFEAASCGCVVLNPNVSDELADLFEPGIEVELFDHVLDCKQWLERHVKDSLRSMKMGVAAWERVQREHLGAHRAQRILDLVPTSIQCAAKGAQARKAMCLTMFSLWEADRLSVEPDYLLHLLEELGEDDDGLEARLRAMAYLKRNRDLEALVAGLLRAGKAKGLRLAGHCSLASLRLGKWDMARLFWLGYMKGNGNTAPVNPETPAQLLQLWARALRREGDIIRSGFLLHEKRHLPTTAMEYLHTALEEAPKNLETYKQLAQITSGMRGAEPSCLGFLSHLALHRPGDWRTSLDLALTHLQAFRMKEGLVELLTAQDKAAQAGESAAFRRILTGRDRSGLLTAALAN